MKKMMMMILMMVKTASISSWIDFSIQTGFSVFSLFLVVLLIPNICELFHNTISRVIEPDFSSLSTIR